MRKNSIKQRLKSSLSLWLSVCMIAGLVIVDEGITTKAAYYDEWTELASSTSTQTLTNGNYLVKENITINGAAGQSGIVISGTVNLYIEEGKTLTVTGGAGSMKDVGGGAGIELPSGAVLKVYGKGRIEATGGAGGKPTIGAKGVASRSFNSVGGDGGSGGGAGIGGKGGSGGAGGARITGDNANPGGDGSAGGSMGTFYVYDSIAVVAAGGKVEEITLDAGKATKDYTYQSNGGSGGAGYYGADIGAGGAGGGGGGGGKGNYLSDNFSGGGGGGQGTSGGEGGGGTGTNNDGTNGSLTAHGTKGAGSGKYAANGGDGGGADTTALGGNTYVASTASAPAGTKTDYTGNVATTKQMAEITLDNGEGSTNQTMVAISGTPLLPLETIPTKAGHEFQGYYSEKNGGGTQYINADGTSTGTDWDNSHTTLYALWKMKEVKLSFVKDGVTGISVTPGTGITDNGDGTYEIMPDTTVTVTPTGIEVDKLFVAWYADDVDFSSADETYSFKMPMKDIELTATALKGVWVEDTITFDPSDFKEETKYSEAKIEVNLNGTPTHMGDVTLVDTDGNSIAVAGSDGKYSYNNILDPAGKEYEVYVGDSATGKKVKFDSETGMTQTIDYYSLTIRTTLDGAPYDPGTIQLVNTGDSDDTMDLFYDGDRGETYHYRMKDDANVYKVIIDGKDTKETVRFTKENILTFAYHTVKISTKLDGALKDMGEVTLQKSADKVDYTLTGAGGTYQIMAMDTGTYGIYVNGKETKKSITLGDPAAEIHYYTVDYSRSDSTVTGTMPVGGVYLEGTKIEVPGQGNLAKANYHFAGWDNTSGTYYPGGEVAITGKMTFTDTWEKDGEPQARWSANGQEPWQLGTYADAVDATQRTPGALTVEFLKSGSLPPNKDITISDNKVWIINDGLDFEIPSTTKVTNKGAITNKGTMSGEGTIANRAAFHNEDGIVKVPTIDNEDGILYGGIYGELNGDTSSRVNITGGQVESTKDAMFILGDYSMMKDVTPADKGTWVSVMGKTEVDGAPTEDQLKYNFGGMAAYDTASKSIKLNGNLHFRDEITFKDVALDPGNNDADGITMPKVSAEAIEEKGSTYVRPRGGTVKITYADSVSDTANKTDMHVPTGAKITLNATADLTGGYEFKGWYQNPAIDSDGVITNPGTLLGTSGKYEVTAVDGDQSYYALFEKKQYDLKVSTDSASKARVEHSDEGSQALDVKETKAIATNHGTILTIEPEVIADSEYSFYGYFKNYDNGKTETIVQMQTVPVDSTWKPGEDWDGTFPEDVPTMEVPMLAPYMTGSATAPFDYDITLLTLVKGTLHYNLAGGKFPDGVSEDQDEKLITDQQNDVTLTTAVPEKPGYIFQKWQRIDTNEKYESGASLSLTGAEANQGITFIAVYEKDSDTKFWAGDQGYKTLDEAVAATQVPGSDVEDVREIIFDDASITAPAPQTGEVYGTLPNGYTLKPNDGEIATLTVSAGKTLQIGEETTQNADNSSDSLKTGAIISGMNLVSDGGQVKLDGQHSQITGGSVILMPGNWLQLISDLNTGNLVKIELWDEKDTPADLATSMSWKENTVVVRSDADDGDTSKEDGTDNTYNLMAGRVRILTEGYSVYNDEQVYQGTGGQSLRLFPTENVKAMRTPRKDASLAYGDPQLVYEYRSIQEAIDAAAKENAGGAAKAEGNEIYVLSDSAENLEIHGDDPSLAGGIFADYGEQSYSSEIALIAGTRTKDNTGTIQVAPGTSSYTLSGNLTVKDVTIDDTTVGTNWKLDDLKLTKTVSVDANSWLQVTGRKAWQAEEKVILIPVKDANQKIANKRVIVEGKDADKAHFKLTDELRSEGYSLYFEDPYLRVKFTGVTVSIKDDIKDAVTVKGMDYRYETTVEYPTGVSDDAAITDQEYQEFGYQWQRKKPGEVTWEPLDETKSTVTFDNGLATIRYESTETDGDTEYEYRCQVWNATSKELGIIPNTRSATLTVQTEPDAFLSIPTDIVLKDEDKKTYIGNTETSEADTSNLIQLLTREDQTIPAGKFEIGTEPTFEITLNGEENPKDYAYRKYVIEAYKADKVTAVGEDGVLMELQEGVLEESRFYLRAPWDPGKMDGVYKGKMIFKITYKSGGNP